MIPAFCMMSAEPALDSSAGHVQYVTIGLSLGKYDKYASVLGSRSPVIKQVNLADGKTKYRAMVGPYRTRQEAVQFCTELKAAGGQCFIP